MTFLGMPAGSGNLQGERSFPAAAREALADAQLRRNLGTATATIRAKRANVVAELAAILSVLGERNELPDIEVLRAQFAPRPASMPLVEVLLPATAVYDDLLEAA